MPTRSFAAGARDERISTRQSEGAVGDVHKNLAQLGHGGSLRQIFTELLALEVVPWAFLE